MGYQTLRFFKTFGFLFILLYLLVSSIPLFDNLITGKPAKETPFQNPWVIFFVLNPGKTLLLLFVLSLAITVAYTCIKTKWRHKPGES